MTKKTFIQSLTSGFNGFADFDKAYNARKIEASLQIDGFEPTLSNLAKIHDCSLDEIQKSLDILETLGLIQWHGSMPKGNQNHIDLEAKTLDSPKQNMVDANRLFTHQLLNEVDITDRFAFRNGFFASDDEVFHEFYKRFCELITWYIDASLNSKRNKVFGYSFTAASVTKEQK